MNVLHLSSEKTWRGGEQQIAYLIGELEKMGVKCFVACRKDSAFHDYCREKLIEHIALPFANNFDLITAWQIRNFCRYMEIDIVHMHSSRSHTMGVMASLFGAGVKLVLSRRVDFPSAGNWLSNYKYNYAGIKKILCVSEKIKEVISPTVRNKRKLEVIYSGIDLKKFEGKTNTGILHREYSLDADTRIVANVSALAPHKDYFTFVNTVAEFTAQHPTQKVKFFIIGEGNCREEIEQYISEKGVQQHIIMTGFRNDIPDILPEIDIFLMTSEEEGLGTTVLDAFANRIPVVATAGGGIPEMVHHQHTGLLFDVKDFIGLTNGLEQILNNPQLASTLTENAFTLLQQKFTKEETARQTNEVYKRI